MGFFEFVASIRKKPLETRRRIATVVTLWSVGGIALLWFLFFFSGLPERIEKMKGAQPATPSSASSLFSDVTLPPFPQFPEGGTETPYFEIQPLASSTEKAPESASATSSGASPERGF